jgi:hypothetical protein
LHIHRASHATLLYEHLQATIELAIQVLQGNKELPHWIKFNEKDMDAMIAALKSWQTEVIKKCSTRDFIHNVCLTQTGEKLLSGGSIPTGCDQEFICAVSGMLLPPPGTIDTELREILDWPIPSTHEGMLRRHIDNDWKPNVTLIDLPFLDQREGLLDVGQYPGELAAKLFTGRLDCTKRSKKAVRRRAELLRHGSKGIE